MFFFFSSRRRHTRCSRDWSSDVCSSDLAAINRARSGYRIQIMPGTYKEQPSRNVPVGAPGKPPCANDYVTVEGDFRFAPPPVGPASNDLPDRANRNYAIKCPNSKYLIAVVGDTRPEPNPSAPILPVCNRLCNL